ncbi:MAG: CBS domain-containing protein [Spirochaetaceae bacterium]|jgi:tRNA nucleotidyltransferase (CCA-adding enzyme)|nr:CBS domain-containing protein [Spirochaetaceae bacterium]
MNVAFGHTGMDLDCFGSLIVIKKLFPDYQLVKSRLLHPSSQNLYTLYRDYFNFAEPRDLKNADIGAVIIVDTSSAARVSEYFEAMNLAKAEIQVFDHHSFEDCDIPGARVTGEKTGANTSLLVNLAVERGVTLSPEEATIALTGIYGDTGKLLYDNVRRRDLEAAMHLLDMGASFKIMKSFLDILNEEEQIAIKNRLLLELEKRTIQGHAVLAAYHELGDNPPGLAAVVEKIMEIENPDAFFACFYRPRLKTMLIIARSQHQGIDLREILAPYGGGGHKLAASAKFPCPDGPVFYNDFISLLEKTIHPALRARDIMTRRVYTIRDTDTLREASMFLERVNLSGAPVMDAAGNLAGFLSLRDIMQGRRVNQMNSMVRGFMSKNVITSDSSVTLREIGAIFFKNHIGHLPIVEHGALTGIVTRWDYVQAQQARHTLGTQRLD